jgi:hypothetical protein
MKVVIQEVTEFRSGNKKVKFSADYDNSIPEDVSFNKATPNANLEAYVNNPAVFDQLKPGNKFYVDFTLIPEESPGSDIPY